MSALAGDLTATECSCGSLPGTGPKSARPDLNRRPPRPKRGALPDCATPRLPLKVRAPGGGAPVRASGAPRQVVVVGRRDVDPPVRVAVCERVAAPRERRVDEAVGLE